MLLFGVDLFIAEYKPKSKDMTSNGNKSRIERNLMREELLKNDQMAFAIVT